MSKRYFWLKLQSNFFDRDDVKLVESMDNGKDYVIFYMKLILKSINSSGKLRFKETIPYNEKMLSHLTGTNIDIVRSALNVFIELGMMERWDDGTLFMNETSNMIGSETSVAQRVRDSRARKAEEDKKPKLLQCNSNETKRNTEIEKELDIELEKEKDNKPPKNLADRFDDWYSIYPKKVSKADAKKVWAKNKLDNKADYLIERLTEQNERQYKHTDKQYIVNPARYLREERYNDDIIDVEAPKQKMRDLSGMDYKPNNDKDYEF